jgi:hypothetical protein
VEGKRLEGSEGYVVRFNFQEALNVTARTLSLFNNDLSNKVTGINSLFAKYHLKPNIYIEHAQSKIFERPPGGSVARVGQWREETIAGLSIIGNIDNLSVRTIFKKKKTQIAPVDSLPKNVIGVEDGKVVE